MVTTYNNSITGDIPKRLHSKWLTLAKSAFGVMLGLITFVLVEGGINSVLPNIIMNNYLILVACFAVGYSEKFFFKALEEEQQTKTYPAMPNMRPNAARPLTL